MAKFLGVKSDPEFIETVCEKCSFTKLRESYNQKKSTDDTGVDPTKFAFRKGRVHYPGYTCFLWHASILFINIITCTTS